MRRVAELGSIYFNDDSFYNLDFQLMIYDFIQNSDFNSTN